MHDQVAVEAALSEGVSGRDSGNAGAVTAFQRDSLSRDSGQNCVTVALSEKSGR
jgi:hypothetical protein